MPEPRRSPAGVRRAVAHFSHESSRPPVVHRVADIRVDADANAEPKAAFAARDMPEGHTLRTRNTGLDID